MTILTQTHVIRLLALGMLLILPATSGAQQRPPILEKLTKTYGLESFGQIEAIRYTFNAEGPGRNVSRSWRRPDMRRSTVLTTEAVSKTMSPPACSGIAVSGREGVEGRRIGFGMIDPAYWTKINISIALNNS